MTRADRGAVSERIRRRGWRVFVTGCLAAGTAVAGLVACVRPPAPTEPPRTVRLPAGDVRLPVRWLGDFPLVETFVDGQGPYRFVLDTGAGITAISPDVGTALAGQPVGQELEIKDSHGRTRKTLGWRVVDLRLGDAEFDQVRAAVVDLDALSMVLGEPLGGILGFPVFSQCLLRLDYPRREVWVGRGELGPVDDREILALTTDPLPRIEVTSGPLWKELFLVDSGSVETLAMQRWPDGSRFIAGPVPIAVGVSLHGSVRIDQVGRLGQPLAFGRHVIEQPVVQSCVEGYRLGTGILSRFAVTFDAARQRVRFQRDRVAPIRMDPVLGTGMVFEIRPGAWTVLAVVAGSPAERAGVQIGDQVVEVDDFSVDELVGVTDWSWASEFTFVIRRRGVVNRFLVGVAPLVP